MGILYNTTETPALNDISVTSGNADGWVLISKETPETPRLVLAPRHGYELRKPAAKPNGRG